MLKVTRWRLGAALSLGGALVALAAACGSDDAAEMQPSPDGSPPDAGVDDAPSDAPAASPSQVDAFCDGTLGLYAPRFESCCDANVAPKTFAFDHTLLRGVHSACKSSLGKSVQSGRAAFGATAATSCATNVSAAIEARTCPDALRTPSNQPSRSIFGEAAGCSEALVGRQAVDAPCANDYECLDGLTCVGWTAESDGVCKAPPGEGASCGYAIPDGGGFIELVRWGFGDHPRCAAGFYCASSALQQGTCRPSKPAEGACDSHDECAEGLRCQLGVCGTAGPSPAGATCERKTDCQDRLYCKRGEDGSVCAPREAAGASCSGELGPECEGACVTRDGGGGTCVAFCGSR